MSAQGLARPRNLAIAGAIGSVALLGFFPRTRKQVLPDTIETPAMQQIGDRHSSGGGTNTHTPAVGTRRGDAGDPSHNESNQEQMKGVGTVHFNDKVADQKANPETGPEKMLNKSYYGSEKGR
ncbi:uncharacterized protein LTR77_002165 [Saxophila tyrrhenica]|uniref:Uncharacterized protein n=1 Tax=Saxophila tyrrhenica TaxID=1690608 RepID=A0AAV9PIR2_9PEZI|nr:hypothetical protein LTR77_002165 [Saxophila tyrrhenica]